MMEIVFLKLLNMSITASWLVLAIMLMRVLFCRAPKALRPVMWSLVGFRLLCPFSLESVLSLIPSAETVPSHILYAQQPEIHSGIPSLNAVINPLLSDSLAPNRTNSVNPMQSLTFVATVVWVAGMIIMLIYTVISYLRVRIKVREAVLLKDNIWLCDHVSTPFILGVVRPRIFLPSSTTEQDMAFVVAHENAHLARRDHWWKPLGFFLLTIYWFNPLLWLAYSLLCRDIELACDEKVLQELGSDIKKPYSHALIRCSIPRRTLAACPLAFGEIGVKSRIRSVLSYKKPALWILIAAVVMCAALAVCFLTDPKNHWESDNYGITGTVSAAECDDVEFKYLYGTTQGANPYIQVEWHNHTDEILYFGTKFTLYKNGLEIQPADNHTWTLPLYAILSEGKRTETYSLSGFDITENGHYRLEKEFYLESDPQTHYIAYVQFYVDRRYSFVGKQYTGEEVVYERGTYSFSMDNAHIPSYAVSDSHFHLLTSEQSQPSASSIWQDIGELQYIQLNKENFDELLTFSDIWDAGYSAQALRRNNRNAFMIRDAENDRLYYLLEQKNGDIFIAYGYTSRNHIRWIFKMKEMASDNTLADESVGTLVYEFRDSVDPLTPKIVLSPANQTFQFLYSGLSSYLPIGRYTLTADTLTLYTDDGAYYYTFSVADDTFTFDAARSSKIPEYRYSEDAEIAESPVPDGAVFVYSRIK